MTLLGEGSPLPQRGGEVVKNVRFEPLIKPGPCVPNGEDEAADKSGVWASWGAGNRSCGVWMKERKEDGWVSAILEAWVQGYVTAFNKWVHPGSNVAEGTDSEGRYAWIDNYCRDHPLDSLAPATENLIRHLRTR